MAKADQDLLASGGRPLGRWQKQQQRSRIMKQTGRWQAAPRTWSPTCPPDSIPDWDWGAVISVTFAELFWINDMAWLSRSPIATLRYVPCLFNQQKIQAIEL